MYVYFIRAGDRYVKIGKSNDPIARLRGLQTANPNELTLMGAIRCESEPESLRLERELQDYWAHRVPEKVGEWFSLQWTELKWLAGFLVSNNATTKPVPITPERIDPPSDRVPDFSKQLARVWTEAELAAHLQVCEGTIVRERKRGKLKYTPIGKKIRFTEAQVLEYLNSQERAADPRQKPKLSVVKGHDR